MAGRLSFAYQDLLDGHIRYLPPQDGTNAPAAIAVASLQASSEDAGFLHVPVGNFFKGLICAL